MFNIFYRPRLSNNEYAPINWFIQLYRWNTICWPLEDGVPSYICWLDRFIWVLGIVTFLIHGHAGLRYLYFHFDNLDEMLTGVPTCLAVGELLSRAFPLGWRKNDLKKLLKKFYAEIYVEKSTNSEIFKRIGRQMWPIRLFAFCYLCAMIIYVVKAVYILATNKREMLYKMKPAFEYENNFYIFFPLFLSNIWAALVVAGMMFGEGNILGLLVFHLNGRYLMMRQSFANKVETILKSDSNCNIVNNYERVLMEAVTENLRLNKFAQEIRQEFTFRIFVMFFFSAMSLCALGFKVYTNPASSITYGFWAVGKIQELLAFGQMGSILSHTTDQLSSMYYESNWENIIARSSHARDNAKLMKFVYLCIAMNRKAFYVTGLNFFNVSLNSVLTILRCAGSYFTFLISLR